MKSALLRDLAEHAMRAAHRPLRVARASLPLFWSGRAHASPGSPELRSLIRSGCMSSPNARELGVKTGCVGEAARHHGQACTDCVGNRRADALPSSRGCRRVRRQVAATGVAAPWWNDRDPRWKSERSLDLRVARRMGLLAAEQVGQRSQPSLAVRLGWPGTYGGPIRPLEDGCFARSRSRGSGHSRQNMGRGPSAPKGVLGAPDQQVAPEGLTFS